MVDLPRVAAHGVRVAGVARHVVHLDLERRAVGGDLEQAHRVLRQREHVRRLRKGHGAQQRLQMEAVGDLGDHPEPVREAEGLHALRRREDGEAVGLIHPELVIVDELVERLLDARHVGLVGARFVQLRQCGGGEVLELDPVGLRILRQRRGGQVEGDARRGARGQQPLDLGARGDVGVESHAGILVTDRERQGRAGTVAVDVRGLDLEGVAVVRERGAVPVVGEDVAVEARACWGGSGGSPGP